MAVPYPQGNPGVFPIDPGTDVGQLRYLIPDIVSEPYSPVQSGFQNYEKFSDSELEAALAVSGDSLLRAAGNAYMSLASQAAMSVVDIQTDDLRYSNKTRASDLMKIAQMWFDRADDEDAVLGLDEAMFIAPTGRGFPDPWPELAQRPAWWC